MMPVSYGHISYVIAETCDILDSIISHDILLSVTYTVFVSLKHDDFKCVAQN